MPISRRNFIIVGTVGLGARALPRLAPTAATKARPILTLVYDKSLGMMRAVERLIP